MTELIRALRAILGETAVLDPTALSARAAGIWRPQALEAAALVRPASTAEVAEVLRWCHERQIPVVTHGGLTGLVCGADAKAGDVILSMERLRAIERIDPVQRTAQVQAGVVLQTLQEEADRHGLFFPLDLGGRGSATLGGNAATNAGGNRVIRYGMTREMVLGLEVVLADGTVISSLNQLIKNNAGYDLKHLFIGSEGTLGVITRLVLRLREKPESSAMALAGLPSFDAVIRLLKHMDRALGGRLSAFEVMWQSFYRLVTTPPAKGRPPISQDFPYYVLVESQGSDAAADAEGFEAALGEALAAGLVGDAALSRSDADCLAFWALRDDVAQAMEGGAPLIFDVSLPLAAMEGFADGLQAALPGAIGPHKLWIFGHLGDGNLHIIVQLPAENARTLRHRVEELIYRPLADCGGSISAEHGIGLEKKPWLPICRSPEEIALMRSLKSALDPKGILNPGKIF